MAGNDLITIMNMRGWKSLRMVQRYASVGSDDMRAYRMKASVEPHLRERAAASHSLNRLACLQALS